MKKRKDGTKLTEDERIEFSKLADDLREKGKSVMERLSAQLPENEKILEAMQK